MDAGEEVGVVADGGWKREPAILGVMKDAWPQRFDLGALAAIGIENVAETAAEREACLAAECEQRVERRAAGGLGSSRGEPVEQGRVRAPRRGRRRRPRSPRRRGQRRPAGRTRTAAGSGSESRRADWPRRPSCAARVNGSRRSWLDLFALP